MKIKKEKPRKSFSELARDLNPIQRDYADRRFRHYERGLFRVITIGLNHKTLKPEVIYESIPNVTETGDPAPIVFTMPLSRFVAEVEHPKTGKKMPRFARSGDA